MRITEKKLRMLIREVLESRMHESSGEDYSSNPIFDKIMPGEYEDDSLHDEMRDDEMYFGDDSEYFASDIEVPEMTSRSRASSNIVPDDLDDWRDTDSYRGLEDEPSDFDLDLIEDPMYMDMDSEDN